LVLSADAYIAGWIEVVDEELLRLTLAGVLILILFLGWGSLGSTLVVSSESWEVTAGSLFALRDKAT
jgi:hypothetical protein